jgi:hypothetical protein
VDLAGNSCGCGEKLRLAAHLIALVRTLEPLTVLAMTTQSNGSDYRYSNGLFDDPTKILVCCLDEEKDSMSALPGSDVPFRLMSEAFPDPSRNFSPKEGPSGSGARDRPVRLANAASMAVSDDLGGAASAGISDGEAADMIEPAVAMERAADMAALFSKGVAW